MRALILMVMLLASVPAFATQPRCPNPRTPDEIFQNDKDLYDSYRTLNTRLSDWVSFTPTGSWTTNVSYAGKYRRTGNTMEVDFAISLTGAPDNTALTINLPTGLTIDTTSLSLSGSNQTVGAANLTDASASQYPAQIYYNSTSSILVKYFSVSGTTIVTTSVSGNTVPFTWATGDRVVGHYSVPIAEW